MYWKAFWRKVYKYFIDLSKYGMKELYTNKYRYWYRGMKLKAVMSFL